MAGDELSDNERALWAAVARTVTPLGQPAATVSRAGRSPRAAAPVPSPPAPPPARSGASHPPQLDGGWERRLSRGVVEPDRVLDLHGLRVDAAWTRLDTVLTEMVESGGRVLLVVAGRDRGPDVRHQPGARGRIRAKLPDWLAASPHAHRVVAVRPAHRRHGGGGAVYIILRRSSRTGR